GLGDEMIREDGSGRVQISGSWMTSTTSPGYFGEGYHFRVAGDGSSRVRWPFPSSAATGSYEVFARWTSGPNRASNATYVVNHAAGSSSVAADQRINGAVWRSLGTYTFSSGAADQGVTLSDKADGVIVADAIRWLPAGSNPQTTTSTTTSTDARFFQETGYRIDRDSFWDFFQKRGGVRAFGFPVSRDFLFAGCSTQLFQREAMQQ